jgi:hypothetical protein
MSRWLKKLAFVPLAGLLCLASAGPGGPLAGAALPLVAVGLLTRVIAITQAFGQS